MARRHLPIADNKVYNEFYDYYLLNSRILSSGNEIMPSVHTIFFDKRTIEGLMLELRGGADGRYYKSGEFKMALIPICEIMLREVEERFKVYCEERISQGYPKPDKMEDSLSTEKLRYEAQLDIFNMEYRELAKRLKTFTDREEKESNAQVLCYGLQCHGKLLGGKLNTIDQQNVAEVDGIMVIADKRSKYDGLSVVTYRELAIKWRTELQEAEKKELLRLQTEAREKGLRIPLQLPVKAPRKFAQSDLPPFPLNEKRYKLNENESVTK